MTDTEIAAVVRHGVELLKGVAVVRRRGELLRGKNLSYAERIKVDGLWVVVRVMSADSQQDRALGEVADVVVE